MGQEALCTVRFGGRSSEGKALLETDFLAFRGDFRLRIPLAEMHSVAAEDGKLVVVLPEGTAVFELGPQAERWATRITNPPTLLDKLGVKPGMRVALVGLADEGFRAQLAERGAEVSDEEPDLVFLGVDTLADLARVAELAAALKPGASLWIVAPKGRKDLRELDVLETGRAAGLTDTKVARFSDTHAAHRFVPRRTRPTRAPPGQARSGPSRR